MDKFPIGTLLLHYTYGLGVVVSYGMITYNIEGYRAKFVDYIEEVEYNEYTISVLNGNFNTALKNAD